MELNLPLLNAKDNVALVIESRNEESCVHHKVIGFSDEHEDRNTGTSWVSSMVIIIANVIGIGVLGLPHAFAMLGWFYGLLTLSVALIGSVYSGLLLTRMKNVVPSAEVFADLGYEAYGNLGRAFVTFFSYTYIIGICFSFQLSASLALKQVTGGLCLVYCALIVAAIVLPMAQYRNLEEMTWFAYCGAIAMVFPLIIIVSEISLRGRYDKVDTSWMVDTGFDGEIVACMDVIFAVAGQVIFVEIMSEMKHPGEFRKSIIGASCVFFVVYHAVGIVGYYFIGSSVLNPITDNLNDQISKRWCAAFVFCHIIVAYVMEVIVLAKAFEHLVLHRQHQDSRHASYQSRVIWFLVTLLIVLCSFLVCNIVPFINDLLGFVGAISGVSTTYVFPFLLAPVLLKSELNTCSRIGLRIVAFLSSLISVVGVYASINRMFKNFSAKSPFSC